MTGATSSRLSWLTVSLMLAVLVAIPARTLREHFSSEYGFVSLMSFGSPSRPNALPEIRELTPPAPRRLGQDGQFYSQLALRPALNDPALNAALDNPQYRARRIGLPLLAHVLGLGKPAWILQIYALLNACFWAILFVALVRQVGCRRPRDLLLLYALLGGAGSLASLEGALTDLPAAVLGTLVLLTRQGSSTAGAALLSASALIKDTSILTFATQWAPRSRPSLTHLLVLFAPLTVWIGYVHLRLDAGIPAPLDVFGLPFQGIAEKLRGGIADLVTAGSETGFYGYARLSIEIVAPASLLIQALYLFANPRLQSPAWRFGIGFGVLLCFVSVLIWVVEANYTRVFLPLTFAFNLLLHECEKGWRYVAWFVAGNCSLGTVLFYQL